jgi:hypothetical protein
MNSLAMKAYDMLYGGVALKATGNSGYARL